MTLEQLRALKAQRVEQMRAIITTASEAGRADLSEDEDKSYENYKAEVAGLNKQIDRMEALDREEASLKQVLPTVSSPAAMQRPAAEAKTEFENFGEFLNAVRFNPNDQRLNYMENPLNAARDHSVSDKTSGGFMVPKQMTTEILRLPTTPPIVRSRARVIPAGSPPDASISFPALDQDGDGNNMYGGVDVQWIGEGQEKPKTDANFREIELAPQEVAAHMVVTDKLLRNWSAADSFLSQLMADVITQAEDVEFMAGNGVKKPLGFGHASNGSRILQPRAVLNQIAYADIVNMFAKARQGGNLVWICNQTALPQIMQMEDGNGNNLWMASPSSGAPSTLLGLPLVVSPRVPALGTTGDLQLVDLSHYLIKDGSGVFVSSSEHVYFTQNKTVIKAFWNVDGRPWLLNPIKEEDGQSYSPFVLLKSAIS